MFRKVFGALLVLLLTSAAARAQSDAIDLSQATVYSSPADIASWPVTTSITRLEMQPNGGAQAGLQFTFSPALPDSWKFFTHPPAGDNYQYTVWAVVKVDGQWYTAGFIEMWQGRPSTGAPILTDFHANWAYNPSRWGRMYDYRPRVGDQMGFFVSAGDARGPTGVTSVRERSNIVLVSLPANDTGVFTYSISPSPTVLISPSGSAGTQTPTYTWTTVNSATWYYLMVQNAGGGPVIQTWYTSASVCGSTTCSITPAVTLAAGNMHTWWVQTWNSSGYGPWSAPLTFTPTALPTATTLTSPTGSVATTAPTYVWNKVGTATWYYLWVNNGGGTPVIRTWYTSASVCGSSTCSVQPSVGLASGNTHTWWVQTWNPSGYGPWSAPLTFTPNGAAATTLVSPTGSVATTRLTYVWNKAATATWYYLWVNNGSGTNVIHVWYLSDDVCGISVCSVTLPVSLASGNAHTWWVQTWNLSGYGPWSAPLSFIPMSGGNHVTAGNLDINGDGLGDAVLYNATTGAVEIELNTGDGAFSGTLAASSPGWQVYPADLDGDGRADLFLYKPAGGSWMEAIKHAGASTITYTNGNWASGWTVYPADLDGDGKTDIFVYNSSTGAWGKYFSDGAGGFTGYTAGTWAPGLSLYPADMNGDGRDDFFLYNQMSGVWLQAFSQAGGGFRYSASSQTQPGLQVFVADLNGDGLTDLFLIDASGVHVSALSLAIGGFDYVAGPQWATGWSIFPTDLNNDGKVDLFLYNPSTGTWREEFSDGAGRFTEASGNWSAGWQVNTTDLNGDGNGDLLLSLPDGTWRQAINTGAGTFSYTTGNWGTGWTIFTKSR